MRMLARIAAYFAFFAPIGYLSFAPAYTAVEPGRSVVTLSFSHGGARKGGCRRLTPEEIAALPPNMRRPLDCPRERVPVAVELRVDGAVLYRAERAPSGIAGDGPSTMFERFEVAPGEHRIAVRLRDSERPGDRAGDHDDALDWETEETVTLAPGEVLAIDFRAEAGGFRFLGR